MDLNFEDRHRSVPKCHESHLLICDHRPPIARGHWSLQRVSSGGQIDKDLQLMEYFADFDRTIRMTQRKRFDAVRAGWWKNETLSEPRVSWQQQFVFPVINSPS